MLPSFIVIGAMKSGTTSLDHYLKSHPQITMPEKEMDFFSRFFENGLEWYESKFVKNGQYKTIFGETSVSYAKHPKHGDVPERIYSVLPDVKLIYVVRDPIDRLLSHYMHLVYADSEPRSLEEVFETEGYDNLYVSYSLYYMQLEKYLEYFDKDRIMIVHSETMRSLDTRMDTLKKIFEFLGVDTEVESSAFYQAKQQRSKKGKKNALARFISTLPLYGRLKKSAPGIIRDTYIKLFTKQLAPPHMPDVIRNRLVEIIKPDVEKLRQFSGIRFDSWSL